MTTYTSNPTAEETNELTALLNEERYARTLANIARRAQTLWDDGYTAKQTTATAHFRYYQVWTPAQDLYLVCLSDDPKDDVFGDSCTCPAWKKYGECKHHLAIQWQVGEAEEAAAWEAMMADGETADGCDPHAEF